MEFEKIADLVHTASKQPYHAFSFFLHIDDFVVCSKQQSYDTAGAVMRTVFFLATVLYRGHAVPAAKYSTGGFPRS